MTHIDPTPPVKEKRTYTNPVYEGYFADPFAWEYEGIYYAVGTGAAEAYGKEEEIADVAIFPLLRSNDFLNWHFAGNALLRQTLRSEIISGHLKLLTVMASSTSITQWGTRTRIINCVLL